MSIRDFIKKEDTLIISCKDYLELQQFLKTIRRYITNKNIKNIELTMKIEYEYL